MPATSPRSKHTLTAEEVKKGGKKSKRGISLKTQFEKLLAGNVPGVVKKYVEDRAIIQKGAYYKLNKKVLSKEGDKALLLAIYAEALAGEGWASSLIVQLFEALKNRTEHTGLDGGPIETETSIKPETLKQVEDLLYKNQAPAKPSKK